MQADPTYAFAYHDRASTSLRLGNYPAAVAGLRAGRWRLQPALLPALLNRAAAERRTGQLPEALRDYDAYLAQKTDNPLAFTNRGNARFENKDYAGAVADFDRAIAARRQVRLRLEQPRRRRAEAQAVRQGQRRRHRGPAPAPRLRRGLPQPRPRPRNAAPGRRSLPGLAPGRRPGPARRQQLRRRGRLHRRSRRRRQRISSLLP
ncbi:MAG: tetratricopeptide repeat protein [Hymenobacter sp.]